MCFAISLGVGVIGVLFFDRSRRKVSRKRISVQLWHYFLLGESGGVTCKVAVSTPTRQTFCMCFAISLGFVVVGVLFFDRSRRKVSRKIFFGSQRSVFGVIQSC